MRYDPHLTVKMVSAYPELKEQFDAKNETDKIIRYCIMMIDEDSPYYKVVNIEKRALNCMKAIEWAPTDKKKISEGRNKPVNNVFDKLFVIYHDTLFETWFSTKIGLHRINSQFRNKEMTAPNLAKSFKELRPINEDMVVYERKLFGTANEKQSAIRTAVRMIKHWPEHMAGEKSPI